MRIRNLQVAAWELAMVSPNGAVRAQAPDRPPNIVFILADDMD
jgi:hypothetical protein